MSPEAESLPPKEPVAPEAPAASAVDPPARAEAAAPAKSTEAKTPPGEDPADKQADKPAENSAAKPPVPPPVRPDDLTSTDADATPIDGPKEGPILAPPKASWLATIEAARSRYGETALRVVMSFALSISLHMLVLALMSVLVSWTRPEPPEEVTLVVGNASLDEYLVEELITIAPNSQIRGETLADAAPIVPEELRMQLESHELPTVPSPLEDSSRDPAVANSPSAEPARNVPWNTPHPQPTGGGLEGRDGETKAKLMAKYGGTAQSEQAVAKALRWLIEHQRPDGSWRFDHAKGNACNGRCGNPGTQGTTTGATALALLPFLGAGHSSARGEHSEVVQRGLYYLSSRMLDTPRGGDYQEGTMYAQGLSAIVLCEGYAMSGDPAWKKPAQRALDYICYAQHPAGGWRYFPGQPGDMTVTGWQIMALKSGQMAKLEVPSPVVEKARRFLDTMQTYGGAHYGYLKPGNEPGPTAVGLLCRLYMGWHPDDERILRGVETLASRGPQKEDVYFNYYATQVLHHAQSKEWPEWNKKMREHLIATQSNSGHEEGSWYFADPHAMTGGRLYSTAFATMILEVYYRHQPLYGERAVKEEL